ncbi:hypothetical protein ACEVHA_028075 [Klebsiella pneumoniae]
MNRISPMTTSTKSTKIILVSLPLAQINGIAADMLSDWPDRFRVNLFMDARAGSAQTRTVRRC